MNRTMWMPAAGLTLALGITGCGAGGQAALEPVDVEGLDNNERVVELAQPVTLGNPDAPISIIEFGDYQCPGCGQFAALVKPQIETVYTTGDDVNFVFYDYPLVSIHPHAFLAARAARCAGDQDAYWRYHTALFRNQSVWSSAPRAPMGLFEDYAEQLGLDPSAFSSCLASDAHAEVVTANMALGNLLGVQSTPTVLISAGGSARQLGDNSFQGIQAVLREIQAGNGSGSGGAGS